MGRSGSFAVLAILAVLGTLSVTRLPRFAVYANERDAARLVRSLAVQLEAEGPSSLGGLRAVHGSPVRAEAGGRWLELDPGLQAPRPVGPPAPESSQEQAATAAWTLLPDLEWLEGNQLLRRHGYLFRARRGSEGVCVEAWPWRHGKTGVAAFRQRGRTALEFNSNKSGLWSGLQAQPPVSSKAAPWSALAD